MSKVHEKGCNGLDASGNHCDCPHVDELSPEEARRRFLISGVPVEAVKSEGGRFYEVTVLKTGAKYRCLANVFEDFAVECGVDKTRWPEGAEL